MIRVGIAGIGFMGWIHWLAWQKTAGAQVVAICDQDAARLQGDWTGIAGNFGPPGEQVDLIGVESFDSLDSFCRADLDIVDICLPPSLHVAAIELAANNGKHVFCEKPLSLTSRSCDSALRTCDAAGQMLMVGHVLPFFPEYRAAREVIESSEFGKNLGGHFKRIISDPTWLPDFYDPQKIGGPLFDLHIHDAHFIRLVAGMPNRVRSCGRMRGEVVQFCHSIFDFDDPRLAVCSTSGSIEQSGRPFTHGFEIYLERATLQFEFAALKSGQESMPLKILKPDGTVELIAIENNDPVCAFEAEIDEVMKSIRSQTPSPILAGQLARDAVQICEAESESVQTRQPVIIGGQCG